MNTRLPCARTEIAFIDPGVSDRQMLLWSLRDEIHAIVLEPTQDGLEQMSKALVGVNALKALHIFANGSPGEVRFSSGSLSISSIFEREQDLARIGDALDPDGELLLWCSETGAGSFGNCFVEALCWATGAPVGAASGQVDACAYGGRWQLDVTVGAMIIPPPFSAAAMSRYTGQASVVPAPFESPGWGPLDAGASMPGRSFALVSALD